MDITKEISMKILQGEKYATTLDEWTSTRNRRYLNINIHDSNGGYHNLGLVRVPSTCPAETAVSLTDMRLAEFGLSFTRDIVASTSDGASVMILSLIHI